jgi:hypothetical protein
LRGDFVSASEIALSGKVPLGFLHFLGNARCGDEIFIKAQLMRLPSRVPRAAAISASALTPATLAILPK